jgi:hypothetical protein
MVDLTELMAQRGQKSVFALWSVLRCGAHSSGAPRGTLSGWHGYYVVICNYVPIERPASQQRT